MEPKCKLGSKVAMTNFVNSECNECNEFTSKIQLHSLHSELQIECGIGLDVVSR